MRTPRLIQNTHRESWVSTAMTTTTSDASSSFPEELIVLNILPEFIKENDWFCYCKSQSQRELLDVTLVHTLVHERCVCMRVILWMEPTDLQFRKCCAASSSRWMENIWLRDVALRRRYMTRRRFRKTWWVFSCLFRSSRLFFGRTFIISTYDLYVYWTFFSLSQCFGRRLCWWLTCISEVFVLVLMTSICLLERKISRSEYVSSLPFFLPLTWVWKWYQFIAHYLFRA